MNERGDWSSFRGAVKSQLTTDEHGWGFVLVRMIVAGFLVNKRSEMERDRG